MSVSNPTYRTDADVVWCPGCGDFGIMSSLAKAFGELELPNENIALISGIGCSSRVPGYFDVFGFNTVHGRALPIAQGVKIARPDLTVVAASGDGDGLGIGVGHFVHAGRRNTDLTLILFDNQIYGLTKGQASPTTPTGEKAKLAPYGVHERPLQPVSMAVMFGATFVARGFSGDPKGLKSLLVSAIQHKGFSVVHVLTPCITFRGVHEPFQTIRSLSKPLADDYNRSDRYGAIRLSELQDPLFMGVFYEEFGRPSFGDLQDAIVDKAIASKHEADIFSVLADFVQ